MENRCENCIVRTLNSFKALKKEELKHISDCKETKTIKKGELIFGEDQAINGLYCVKSGVSKLSKISDNGKSQIIKLINKGGVIGQRTLVSDNYSNLSAEALSDMQVCFIPKSALDHPLKTNLEYNKELMHYFADSLKESDNEMVNMAQKSIIERLAHILLHLETVFGLDEDGFINVILTREDYADLIGTVKESCIRNFSKLKDKSLIEVQGKKVKIINKPCLRQLEQGF